MLSPDTILSISISQMRNWGHGQLVGDGAGTGTLPVTTTQVMTFLWVRVPSLSTERANSLKLKDLHWMNDSLNHT